MSDRKQRGLVPCETCHDALVQPGRQCSSCRGRERSRFDGPERQRKALGLVAPRAPRAAKIAGVRRFGQDGRSRAR